MRRTIIKNFFSACAGSITRLVALSAVLAVCSVLGAPVASAQTSPGATVTNGCMDDLFPGTLGCTANDVRIGTATDIVITDPCAYPGDDVTFNATFEVLLGAQARYDIGLYFATDGDPNGDGALTGTCSISTLPEAPDPPFVDLDATCKGGACPQPEDLCGDIDSKHNPIFRTVTISAVCVDNDKDGFLDLPNCTSWRQSGANEVCLSPLDAFPGSPSKCRCDPGFNVAVPVPDAELQVVKTAAQLSVDEPGGLVTFSVSVTNTGVDPNNAVELDTLDDNIYGDITMVQGEITSTTCSLPQTLGGNGGTYDCQFTAFVGGNAGAEVMDVVLASGIDGNGTTVQGTDDATVTINDVAPAITVVKTADPTEVLEPGGLVAFTVDVTNNSVSTDPVTINSLTDNIHGNLNGQGGCLVPQTIESGATYSCFFTATVSGNAGDNEEDTVTASGTDDDGSSVSDSDNALVDINDVPSSILVTKTAEPTSVDEPGANVLFSFTVENTSLVDEVTIDTLTDSIYGDLNGAGDCFVPQMIAAGGSYSCAATFFVAGDAGDEIENVATASGLDDDGNPVSDDDNAMVNINDVPPAASLTKTATMVVATFEVVVTNDSEAEALTLDSLVDDEFGDITQVQGKVLSTTCGATTIAIDGSYTCSFEGKVTSSPHVNTVTGTLSDNDVTDPEITVTPFDSATVTFE